MNKQELISKTAKKAKVKREEAEHIILSMIDVVVETLADGESVRVPEIGTLDVKHRDARMARNPQTGEKVMVEATNVPSFKASKTLKDAVK